jgi:hypothetical protein
MYLEADEEGRMQSIQGSRQGEVPIMPRVMSFDLLDQRKHSRGTRPIDQNYYLEPKDYTRALALVKVAKFQQLTRCLGAEEVHRIRGEVSSTKGSISAVAQSIKPTLTQTLNAGSFREALTEAAAEQGWYEIIDEINNEWIFLSQEGDSADKDRRPGLILDPNSLDSVSTKDEPFGAETTLRGDDTKSDGQIYLGGGNDGVFFDYSEANRENAGNVRGY